jgi:hypothetical protein
LSREFRRSSPVESRWHPRSHPHARHDVPNWIPEIAEYIELPHSPPMRARPRERVTTEYLQVDAHSPRSSEALIVEASPSRHRSRSRHHGDYEEVVERVERPRVNGISRRRAVSVHDHGRHLAPVQYIEERESDGVRTGPMVLVRPRDSDYEDSDYVRHLEEEMRLLRMERQGGIEITNQRETDLIDNRGNQEEITEVRRSERRGTVSSNLVLSTVLTYLLEPNSRIMRAMMATLT